MHLWGSSCACLCGVCVCVCMFVCLFFVCICIYASMTGYVCVCSCLVFVCGFLCVCMIVSLCPCLCCLCVGSARASPNGISRSDILGSWPTWMEEEEEEVALGTAYCP